MAQSTGNQADVDRGSSFAAEMARDRDHRDKARTAKPLRKLLPYVLKYPGLLVAFAVFLATSSMLTLTLPVAFRLVVDCGFADQPNLAVCDRFAADGKISVYVAIAIGLAFALGVASALRFYFISRLGERVVADLRRKTYDHLLGLSPGFFDQVRTGEVLSRLTTDTTLIQTVVGSSISVAVRTFATTTGALALMFFVSWKLSVLVLLIGPIIIGPILLFGRRVQRLSRSTQDQLADASARASEALRSIETVQAFTAEDQERDRFAAAVEATYAVAMRRVRVRSFMSALIFGAVLSGLIGILGLGALQVQSGALTAGEMTQFVMYAFIAVSGAGLLTETYAEVMRAAGATERLMELNSTQTDLPTRPDATVFSEPAKGVLAFDKVSFSYPLRPNTRALMDISFRVNAGETVALVGPSGAGKSTIFQMLLRFYDPDGGVISVDGHDLRHLDPHSLRAQIAVVQQDAPLFSGSVLDNIGFGKACASDEDIIKAAKAANAHEFIMRLPEGYGTVLGEGGSALSGGQRQRLAIARAVLRDTPILLLDEATSSLDSESEAAIKDALEAISADKTLLIIAHRLSTVMKADNILFIEAGRVLASGTHEELLRQDGRYADLAKLQFGDHEPAG